MSLATLLIALAAAAGSARAGERLAIYPVSLPAPDKAHALRIASWVRDSAMAVPGVGVVDVLTTGSCLPDEGRCAGLAAKAAGAASVLTVRVDGTDKGYKFHVRRFATTGEPRGEERAELLGGPLDLAAAVEGAACKLLAGSPCVGEVQLSAPAGLAGQTVTIAGREAGKLPLATATAPVGRHAVRVGQAEQRVRVSRGKPAKLAIAGTAGKVVLAEEGAGALAPVVLPKANGVEKPFEKTKLHSAAYMKVSIPLRDPSMDGRAVAGRALVATGLGLVAAGAGVALYAQLARPPSQAVAASSTALVQTDPPAVRRASIGAIALFATGLGALGAGSVVFAFNPSGAGVAGKF